ncbi:hypothetical protein ABNQ39_11435 [Azospirillum sp. A26]|uniref:head-tail joining protein n=1 Tax=Azospirillum sp. A26 TaxID=3160607 RepID=UPI00367336D7
MDFARHMAVQFRKLGLPAVHTPPAGPAADCRVMRATKPLRFGALELPVDGHCFDLLRAEVTPAVGGTLEVDGTAYAIDAPPVPFPLETDPQGLRWRLMSGWGLPATIRLSADTSPPRGSEWVVAEDVVAGAVELSISGTLASGKVQPGDAFSLPGHAASYVAAGAVVAVAGTFAAVPISPALAAPVAAGTAVSPAWATDSPVRAFPLSASVGFVGSVVDTNGRYLILAAGLPSRPAAGNLLMVDGDDLEIASVTAHRSGSSVIAWEVRAT